MLSYPHRRPAPRRVVAGAGHTAMLPAGGLLLAIWLVVCGASVAGQAAANGLASGSALLSPSPSAGITRSQHHYPIPALRLQRADGSQHTLQDALADGRPVVMTFMYSSCATVCPITNQTLAAFEQWLGPDLGQVNTVSISIDPDHDSVKRLATHARQTGARGSFYTSDPGTSEAVQRAFDAWRGDKMNHQPVFLLRSQPGRQWLRLDGLVTPAQLIAEFKRLSQRGP